MENASKALLMAGGVLVAIVIISLLVSSVSTTSAFKKAQISQELEEEITAFNEKFTKYANQYVYGTEVITVINMALDNPEHEITVTVDFESAYTYEGYEEYIVGGKKRWRKATISVPAGPATIVNYKKSDPTTNSFINSLGSTNLNTMAFKCTNIGYDNLTKRVNSITFVEKKWGDLY